MKKVLIGIVLFVCAYFAQLIFMKNLSQNFLDKLSKNNEFYTVSKLEVKQGFFSSQASFEIKLNDKRFDFLQSKVHLNFYHFIFTDIKGSLSNPFELFKESLEHNQLARLKITLFPNQTSKIKVQFADINLSKEGGNVVLKNANSELLLNENARFEKLIYNIDKAEFASFAKIIALKDFSYEKEFKNTLKTQDLDPTSSLKIQEFLFDTMKMKNLSLKYNIYKENNETLNIFAVLNADELGFKFPYKNFTLNEELANINSTFKAVIFCANLWQEFRDFKGLLELFKDLQLHLDFFKNTSKIKIQTNLRNSKNTLFLTSNIQIPKEPSKLFEFFDFDGEDYFLKKDDFFEMNVNAIFDANKSQIKVNNNTLHPSFFK